MKLTAQILGVMVAASMLFMALAMVEEWQVFAPWLAGEGPGIVPPGEVEVERALRDYARRVQGGEKVGAARSQASMADHHDRGFRQRAAIEQTLRLDKLTIAKIAIAGPARFFVDTDEVSALRIGGAGKVPSYYRVSGRYRYTLVRTEEGLLRVAEVELDGVSLDTADAEAPW